MIQTAEQIIESIRALPPAEQVKILGFVKAEISDRPAKNGSSQNEVAARNERFRKAQQWIKENKGEYDGQFVLLNGDVLLGHGNDAQALYAYARSIGIESPFVERIKAVELPFGGW